MTMPGTTTAIWRKDPSTNRWKQVCTCDVSAAHQWLLHHQAAEPEVTFKISAKKPTD
jgi:hypothetical protein